MWRASRHFQPGEGPNRGLLCDCENWLWNRWIVCSTNPGAVCRGVALPGVLLAFMLNTEAGCWVVSAWNYWDLKHVLRNFALRMKHTCNHSPCNPPHHILLESLGYSTHYLGHHLDEDLSSNTVHGCTCSSHLQGRACSLGWRCMADPYPVVLLWFVPAPGSPWPPAEATQTSLQVVTEKCGF